MSRASAATRARKEPPHADATGVAVTTDGTGGVVASAPMTDGGKGGDGQKQHQQQSAVAGGAPLLEPISNRPTMAGALVLRGNRCVLVRSLSSPPEWPGVRLPFVALRDGETSTAA